MMAMLQVDPRGMGCLWEQMCHPLATVVLFPQCPVGSSLGKKRTEDNVLGKLLRRLRSGLGCLRLSSRSNFKAECESVRRDLWKQ